MGSFWRKQLTKKTMSDLPSSSLDEHEFTAELMLLLTLLGMPWPTGDAKIMKLTDSPLLSEYLRAWYANPVAELLGEGVAVTSRLLMPCLSPAPNLCVSWT